MIFSTNTSPGPAARASTSPRASCASASTRSRRNVSMRIEDTDSPDSIKVTGRGELAARHPHRDDAPRRLRNAGFAADRGHPRDRRRQARAGRAAGGRRGRGLRRRGLAAARPAQGQDDQDDAGRHRPHAYRVQGAVARPDRLALALPHRDARHRHHERAVRRLGALARDDRGAHQRRAGLPIAKAWRRRTRSSTSRNAA